VSSARYCDLQRHLTQKNAIRLGYALRGWAFLISVIGTFIGAIPATVALALPGHPLISRREYSVQVLKVTMSIIALATFLSGKKKHLKIINYSLRD